jgi:hypothetical protein
MDHKDQLHISRKLGETLSQQNARIDDAMDQIVATSSGQIDAGGRRDWSELKKTTEMFIFNSLVMGNHDPSNDDDGC